jgi:hypothetical protein
LAREHESDRPSLDQTLSTVLNVLGWGTTAVMAIAAIALVVITVAG